jgi:putative ABC transport system permease protein
MFIMPKAFPAEFRRDVVAVARKHEAPISQVARDFGISEACLHRWLKVADVEDGVRPGTTAGENAVLIGRYNEDRKDLAAIDPRGFLQVAALSDAFFADGSAAHAMDALAHDPRGLLIDSRTAGDLAVAKGDHVQVLLARGTKRQALRTFHVLGLFDRFPGFPQGVNLVADLAGYGAATGSTQPDFFLARANDRSHAGLARAVAAVRSGPGRRDPVNIDTTETNLDKDQSSLTALNVHGLVDLDSLFTLLMTAAVIAIFVFGLMLQRRREYVTLQALGMPIAQVRALVLGEAGLVAGSGLVAGMLVGTTMAVLFVRVLRPLFILDPSTTFPVGDLLTTAVITIAATVAAALAATAMLSRLRPTELLREA